MSDYIREWVALLPCPFCGGEKLLTTTNEFGGFCFTCENCDAVGPPSDYDPQQMREAWNTRADAALAEIGARRAHQGYDLELLNSLLDYIERIEKTEHGMDGAVREIARRAAVIRGPVFRSGRGKE